VSTLTHEVTAQRKPGHSRRRSTALLLCVAVAWAASATSEAAPEATRETMKKVFGALSTLLPVALASSGWEDPARRDEVRKALAALAGAADQLQQHGGPEAQSFSFLSQSLGSDARAIQQRVAQRRYDSASYLTQRLTETCVACHVRLPAKSTAGFSDALLERVDRAMLSPLSRARLQTATRQFDAGLTTYETQFANPGAPIALLEYELPSYLIVALRVRQDPQRAERGLAILGQRPDLSAQLEQNLGIWRSAIDELAPALKQTPSLERARGVLAAGRNLSEFPSDGADLAHAVLASSIVFRFLEQSKPQGLELAEALYLLGQTEAFTRRSFELSDAEHYLEQTIRIAPHTPLAERAYARLEREVVLGYTGSAGEQVPADVQKRLRELRELGRAAAGNRDESRDPASDAPGTDPVQPAPQSRPGTKPRR
jgi:hypothetical protein